MMHATDYTVEGAGEFPFDMLRYDHSFPASEDESGMLYECEETGKRTVKLTTYHDGKQHHINPERWESFLWRVVGEPVTRS